MDDFHSNGWTKDLNDFDKLLARIRNSPPISPAVVNKTNVFDLSPPVSAAQSPTDTPPTGSAVPKLLPSLPMEESHLGLSPTAQPFFPRSPVKYRVITNRPDSMIDDFTLLRASPSLGVRRPIPTPSYDITRLETSPRQYGYRRRPRPRCAFCHNNNETEVVYTSHTLRDRLGRISCPVLAAYVCPLCGATGFGAHTIKYCPLNCGEGTDVKALQTSRTSAGLRKRRF